MCPWTGLTQKKTIYDDDCAKLFKTKSLAKHITNSEILCTAFKSLSSLSKRCELIEKAVSSIDAEIFFDEKEQLTHSLNEYLLSQISSIEATDESAQKQIDLLLKIVDGNYLCQKLTIPDLKKILLPAFNRSLSCLLERSEAARYSLCLRMLLAAQTDKEICQQIFNKDGFIYPLLIEQLSVQSLPVKQKAELFIALLRLKSGHAMFNRVRDRLLPQLNAEMISYLNEHNESVLLYLITDISLFLFFAQTNLFERLDTSIVYAIAKHGRHQGQHIVSRLTKGTPHLDILLALKHDAKLLSVLEKADVKEIFIRWHNGNKLVDTIAKELTSMCAFKRIEQSLFDIRKLDLFQKKEMQEAIGKLYLKMTDGDEVLIQDDREHLTQHMQGEALNCKDSKQCSVASRLRDFEEGVEKLREMGASEHILAESSDDTVVDNDISAQTQTMNI